MTFIILDCTPARADVVSGAVARPRARRKRENARQWLRATPAWARALDHWGFGPDDRPPGVEHRSGLRPPATLGLSSFPHIFSVTWEGGAALLCVNADGTRCAIVDMIGEIGRLWAVTSRPRAGRPRIETNNPKTLASRAYRERARQAKTQK